MIIDSGSTQPECREIIKEYCDKYDHMYYKFFDENINQMPAYNCALQYVQEEWPEISYFSCLDSDDKLAIASLERGVEVMESDDRIGIIYSDFNIIDSKSKLVTKRHLKSKRLVPEKDELSEEGQKKYRFYQVHPKVGNFATHLRVIRIKDLVEKMNGFSEEFPFSTDFSIYASALDTGVVLKKVDQVLYHWRVHNVKTKGQTRQVQADHGQIQHGDYLTLRDFYKDKWEREGSIQ